MHMHVAKMYAGKDYLKTLARSYGRVLALAAFLIVFPSSCHTQGNVSTEETRFVAADDSDEFHADNDIAMTIRSIVDAIKVGEPLDSSLYDFEGILTDGQGTPLYTDIQGSPGLWNIDVIDNRNVVIRNLYLGDLLPADLRTYLLQSLDMATVPPFIITDSICTIAAPSTNLLSGQENEYDEMTVYDFGGGYLCFDIQPGMAPNGLEGPLLSIIMTADYPTPNRDGIQTNESVQNVAKP